MTNIDQFESAFRSASKAMFEFERVEIAKALVITDLDEAGAAAFGGRARRLLSILESRGETKWREVAADASRTIGDLLALVEVEKPDLVCAYRNLHSQAWKWPYTLGDHVEVLTQATHVPILVLPHPEAARAADHAFENTSSVMAMTDHLTGSDRLVSWAAHFTEREGTLHLAHVEDESVFERVISVIGKIPTIDTDHAREAIQAQLLKEPEDYIVSCRDGLLAAKVPTNINKLVVMGHRLEEYRRLVEDHEVDLLVLNTKDEDQLAMHGMAYPLAVELREIPLLLL